jgi:hypothetical protein
MFRMPRSGSRPVGRTRGRDDPRYPRYLQYSFIRHNILVLPNEPPARSAGSALHNLSWHPSQARGGIFRTDGSQGNNPSKSALRELSTISQSLFCTFD